MHSLEDEKLVKWTNYLKKKIKKNNTSTCVGGKRHELEKSSAGGGVSVAEQGVLSPHTGQIKTLLSPM